ncbi:MAG: SAM-dependent chlorinase/fluorinase [Gemmatimonadales bacterium]|nr:SAM-dependent chlorinase/fluorinase [Gemmatimonadales bacterium]
MGPVVTLLTDFGWSDPWVGAVKGVLYSEWDRWPGLIAPPPVVDLSHDVPAGDIEAAAWFLGNVVFTYPVGTIHLAVVDPGVGGDRPALALALGGHFLVGPGNGLFRGLVDRVLEKRGNQALAIVQLDNSLYHRTGASGGISETFQGRDVFAPVAAHLAMGIPLEQLGSAVGPEALGELPGLGFPEGSGAGGPMYRIRWIDRFGNGISDLERDSIAGLQLDGGREVEVAGHRIPGPVSAYVHAEPGSPFWYWGSADTLEIALRDEDASVFLGLHRGLALRVPGM